MAPSQIIGSVGGHSMKPLSDSLAVAWNFNHIDSSFTLSDHSAIMDAAGINELEDLDTLTKGLHQVIIGSENTNMWEGIYNIFNATASGSIKVLAGKSTASILDHYNQSEASKKGVIYAALEGLPFSYDDTNIAAYNDIDPDDFSSQAANDLVSMLMC